MTQREFEHSNPGDERIERLISRALDGELGEDDRWEFEALIRTNPDARALFESYERVDALASASLAADFDGGAGRAHHDASGNGQSTFEYPTAARSAFGWRRQLRVGIAAAVLAAAAMIVVASLPMSRVTSLFSSDGDRSVAKTGNGQHDWPKAPATGNGAPMFVDYQTPVHQPQRIRDDVFRDVIGVQGDDPNVIIILERQTRAARVETVSGDI